MTSSLRSRIIFPKPEGDLDDRRDLSGSEEELTYDIYQSPCAYFASNDLFEPEQIDEFEVCDTTFYGRCLEEPPASSESNGVDIIELQIVFDFELWHRRKSDATKTLRHLEAVILEHVASVLSLKDCDNDRKERRRTQYQHDFTDDQLDMIVGVSSETTDFEDTDFDSCFIPVTKEQSAGAVCNPATGVMTAYVRDDPTLETPDKAVIISGIQRLIRWGMQEDIYVGGNTQHVSFIGTRTGEGDFDSFRQSDALQGTIDTKIGGKNQTGAVIGGLTGLVLLVALLLFFVARPKKEEKLEQDISDAVVTSNGKEQQGESSGEIANPVPWLKKSKEQQHSPRSNLRVETLPSHVIADSDPNVSALSIS